MKLRNLIGLAAAVVALGVTSVPVQAAAKTDDLIESSAKESYVFKTYLKDDDVKIQSKDGAVTLTGTVSGEYHKSLAQETVAGLPGVKGVDNRLEIKGAPTANSDAWVRDKVKVTLLFHRNVSVGTEVDVKDGNVTLRGTAASAAERDLTTEYARDVDGVKDVKNEMTVAGAPAPRTVGDKVDDASITAQVKVALLFHRSTSALKTTVSTKNGEVTVSGKAENAAEIDLVTKLVDDVHGVTKVRNKMTVEGHKTK